MPVLDAIDLRKSYGPSTVLDGVSVTLRRGERIGLVGANGSGKSTLVRILAGLEEPDAGRVAKRQGAKVAYLAQEPPLPEDQSVLEVVLGGLGEWLEAKRRYDELSAALSEGQSSTERLLERQQTAALEIERLGGWNRRNEAEAVLSKLSIDAWERKVQQLSGGERRRVGLARTLVAQADLTILDEPTNHLDAETIEWLEEYLLDKLSGTLLLITHDRYLLDRVVTRTLEIEGGQLYAYEGGWEDYLLGRAEREALAQRTEANRQNFLRRELEWLQRQPKARTGKQKARIQRAEKAQHAEPRSNAPGALDLRVASQRLGSTILEAHDLSVDMGTRRLVAGLTLHLTRGERIGIIGRNGAGKTTLLRCLLHEHPAAVGRVVHGKNTSFAYLDQARSGLDPSRSVLDTVTDGRVTLSIGTQTLSSYAYLERFQLSGGRLRQPVGSLSGGERTRVVLAKLLLSPANVLVLDEPTNDLDVTTLAALEEMLTALDGSALVVSHDRYFLDRVATSLLVLQGDGRFAHVPGTYSSYALRRAEEEREATRQQSEQKSSNKARGGASSNVRRGLTYAEKLELEGLLDRVEAAASRVSELEAALAHPELYREGPEQAMALERDLLEARCEAEKLENRWLQLEEKRENDSG